MVVRDLPVMFERTIGLKKADIFGSGWRIIENWQRVKVEGRIIGFE